MKKRICVHCGGEISGSRGGRAVYCSEKCQRSVKNKRLAENRAAGLIAPSKHRPAKAPLVPAKDVDRLFKHCSVAIGDCDPWLERRDCGQYNYNADFVLGF